MPSYVIGHSVLVLAVFPHTAPLSLSLLSYGLICSHFMTLSSCNCATYKFMFFNFCLSTAHILTAYLQRLPPHTVYLELGWLHPPQLNVPVWAEAPLYAALFMVVSSGSAGYLRMPHQPPPLCPAMPVRCPMPALVPPQISSPNSPPSLHAGRRDNRLDKHVWSSENIYLFICPVTQAWPTHELLAFCI